MSGKLPYLLAGIPWVVVGGVVGFAVHRTPSSAAQFEASPLAAPAVQFPGARINYVGSGTYRVPSQVAPGTYVFTATGNTFGCTWERLKADDDKPKSIIDSGSVNRGGFGQFSVKPGDRVVKMIGDCTWAAL